MRIPSGDLAPARKRRRGYSARRRRSPLPYLLVLLLLAGAAGGAYLLRREDRGAGAVTAKARCTPPPAATPSAGAPAPVKAAPLRLPQPAQVGLRLLNGTGRNGLARTVGDELARRGFTVVGMGNAPRPLAGASRVYFGPGARAAATLVSAHVLGAEIQAVPTAGKGAVDVVLGSRFVRLRTAPEVSAYARGLTTGPAPAAPTPHPVPSATC